MAGQDSSLKQKGRGGERKSEGQQIKSRQRMGRGEKRNYFVVWRSGRVLQQVGKTEDLEMFGGERNSRGGNGGGRNLAEVYDLVPP